VDLFPIKFTFSDIPRIAGPSGTIFRLTEARRNEIRSQPTGWQPEWRDARPRRAETRRFAFIKAHLSRLRLRNCPLRLNAQSSSV
jgi:hypothetical protein